MPTGSKRSGFSFAVSHNTAHQQVRIVERSTVRMRDGVSELSSFVNRARSLRRNVAGNSTWERELLEEPLHTFHALRNVRINLAVSAFQIGVGHNSRSTVTRADDVDHIQVVALDHPIEVRVDEIQPWCCAPMS